MDISVIIGIIVASVAVLGFLGNEPQAAWGGVGLLISSLVVWRFVRS